MKATLESRYEQTLSKPTNSYMKRAKKHWIKDGDTNTAYFHRSIIKRRRGRNIIASIKDDNNVLQHMPYKISNTFVNYFRSIFASSNTDHGRPFLSTQLPQDTSDYTYSKRSVRNPQRNEKKYLSWAGWIQRGVLHCDLELDW
jgi:hypothetical protein